MDDTLKCAKCKATLNSRVVDRKTVCPNCGKMWELTEDGKSIKTTTLVVHPGKHGIKSRIQGEKDG